MLPVCNTLSLPRRPSFFVTIRFIETVANIISISDLTLCFNKAKRIGRGATTVNASSNDEKTMALNSFQMGLWRKVSNLAHLIKTRTNFGFLNELKIFNACPVLSGE